MVDVTRWGRDVDELAGAVAGLLTDTSVRRRPLTDVPGVLVCRDAVVVGLRQLVGSVADMPPVARARPLTMFDVANRPAQALQLALSGLPRASAFGSGNVDIYLEKGLPSYEQRWRDAARAAAGMEIFVEPLRQVPDRNSWAVLRDLADLAAALPALDHHLSEAVLPWLKAGEDLAVPYAVLTHPGHDAVRVCASEVRSRVPAVVPSTTAAPLMPAGLSAGEVDNAMARYVRTVLDRGPELSMGDLRAVTRLLQLGGTHAAVALERAQHAVPAAGATAAALRQVVPLAEQLGDSPAKTLGPERLRLLRDGRELLVRMDALSTHGRLMSGVVTDAALRRLAAPAVEFAEQVPQLTRAVEIGVRESLSGGLMLVPSAPDNRNDSTLLWVPNRGSGRGQTSGPPVVQQHARTLATAAQGVTPGVRTAQAALDQHRVQVADPARDAAAQARSHVGAARAQLREVLRQQAGTFPPPLSSPLPSHPRLAPDGPMSGRAR